MMVEEGQEGNGPALDNDRRREGKRSTVRDRPADMLEDEII